MSATPTHATDLDPLATLDELELIEHWHLRHFLLSGSIELGWIHQPDKIDWHPLSLAGLIESKYLRHRREPKGTIDLFEPNKTFLYCDTLLRLTPSGVRALEHLGPGRFRPAAGNSDRVLDRLIKWALRFKQTHHSRADIETMARHRRQGAREAYKAGRLRVGCELEDEADWFATIAANYHNRSFKNFQRMLRWSDLKWISAGSELVFTLGYEGRTLESFIDRLDTYGIERVIDARERPQSRKKGFSKTALARALGDAGIEYAHRRELGNPKHIRKNASATHIEILEAYDAHMAERWDEVLAPILPQLSRRRVCLICYEKDPATCHRTRIAAAIRHRSSARVVAL